ncbi:Putative uncharacterized protein [Moritella viscosa]|nr:Putative uncharacterized protein [Moritella viscosa]
MHKVMNQWQHYDSSDLSTMSKELNDLVEHCCFAWDNWLTTVIKAQLAKEEACFSQIHLEKVKDTCTYVAEQLVLLAKSDAMQQGELSELRINQKYALLAKSLVQLYQEKMVIHVQEFFGEIQADLVRTMGYETLLRMNTKRYVDLVLYHQLSLHSAELEMKHTGIKYKRDVELKSPNAFIYTRLHGGLKADDIRVSYRWLFINAWLCSWLKVNDVSANKAALHIAKDDLFFYLKDDSEKLNDYGEVATLEERHARRQKRLNTEFSKWKKYSGNFAYISDGLFKKSSRGYRNQIKREQKRNEKEELAKKS